jgi:hypothetical protein
MVKHDISVRGVQMNGQAQKPPVILQMNDDDFPGRFLTDLASPGEPPISTAISVDQVSPPQNPPILFQPVQRMTNLAMVKLSCEVAGHPMVDPKRIEWAGLVIRLVNAGSDSKPFSAWMRTPQGQFGWVPLNRQQECWDPDPSRRPQLYSGQAELDRKLGAMTLSTANAEVSTPAFAAPPDVCVNLNRTVVYALIPTASSEVSDATPPRAPLNDSSLLADNLPQLLKEGAHSAPVPSQVVDYRWMSDEYLATVFPPGDLASSANIAQFQTFSTTLRMLDSVFGAFGKNDHGILTALNNHNVQIWTTTDSIFGIPIPTIVTTKMGDFYRSAKTTLLDYSAYGNSSQAPPTLTMPFLWDEFSHQDAEDLLTALMNALTPRAIRAATPLGRFQNRNNLYRLRVFFRIKGETPGCPSELVWSEYSEPFSIASWYDSSDRPHPPVPLPEPTLAFLQSAKPNCSFHVPKGLMGAMQGTTMSGLMKGSGGGASLSLDWICGFNIPIITICAFFVLNIFLILLNIVFFWLPFVKICIPFPTGQGDE